MLYVYIKSKEFEKKSFKNERNGKSPQVLRSQFRLKSKRKKVLSNFLCKKRLENSVKGAQANQNKKGFYHGTTEKRF